MNSSGYSDIVIKWNTFVMEHELAPLLVDLRTNYVYLYRVGFGCVDVADVL